MIGFMICFLMMLILHLLTPYWWWVIVVPLVYAFLRSDSGRQGFRIGAASAGLLWFLASFYFLLDGGENIARRIAEMLGTRYGFSVALLATLIAILTAGLSGMAGYHFRGLFARTPAQRLPGS